MKCKQCGKKVKKNKKFCNQKCYIKYLKNGKHNPMYGKHLSDKAKKQIRLSKLGRKPSAIALKHQKERIPKGKKHWNYKYGHTMKKHYCQGKNCQEEIGYKCWQYGHRLCQSCWAKLRFSIPSNTTMYGRKGKLAGNYVNGKGYEPYTSEFNDTLKESIRKRDNYECQNCGMTEEEHLIIYGFNLEIHHINYDKKNCKDNNLITVCRGCNIRANYNRNYWKSFYQNKIVSNKLEEIK